MDTRKPERLFVFSGGGMPGIDIHAGILSALEDRGVTPSAIAGTSAGAIVGALLATDMSAAGIVSIVSNLRDRDVRDDRFLWKLRIPWLDSFISNEPIRRILADHLPPSTDSLRIGLSVWATEFLSGAPTNLIAEGFPLVDSVLASMSICGVFPPVGMPDGLFYVDGGVRCNLPLPADWRRYDEVYLLIASQRPDSYRKMSGILTHLLRNVQYLMLDQIEDVLDIVADERSRDPHTPGKVRVIWPQLPTPGGALHFDHALIGKAATFAANVLDMLGITPFDPIPLKETSSC